MRDLTLWRKAAFTSLTLYSENIIVNVVIMALIIFGGIGFLTWEDIKKNKFHFRKYRMQSKVILVFTVFLIVVPALYFYFAELGAPVFSGLSSRQRASWSSISIGNYENGRF